MPKQRSIDTLTIDGGWLCFNFINTVYAWRGKNLHEYLPDYTQFILWCSKLNLLPEDQLKHLQLIAGRSPQKADEAMHTITSARRTFYNFFSALAAGNEEQMQVALPAFNALLGEALARLQFTINGGAVSVDLSADDDLLQPLWIVVKSAYDALTLFDQHRIKECPTCGWMFRDQTKNGKKRWCSPTSCGSIDKTKRYYLKKKTGE